MNQFAFALRPLAFNKFSGEPSNTGWKSYDEVLYCLLGEHNPQRELSQGVLQVYAVMREAWF